MFSLRNKKKKSLNYPQYSLLSVALHSSICLKENICCSLSSKASQTHVTRGHTFPFFTNIENHP